MSRKARKSETIKCVLVGDTGVGKSKLITCKVTNWTANIDQLVGPHVPAVWALDQRKPEIEIIEKAQVPYKIWDTFGDHKNDRCFAYAGADVFLICYSVISRRSLINAEHFWYKEIRHLCDNVPVLLVACKTDLRSISYRIEEDKFLRKLPHHIRSMKSDEIVLPAEGRLTARSMNAYYYSETNILNRDGVDETFNCAIKAAVHYRRSNFPPSFWTTSNNVPDLCRSSNAAFLQVPLLPSKPDFNFEDLEHLRVERKCSRSDYEADMLKLLHDPDYQPFFDCILRLGAENDDAAHGRVEIAVHKLVIASAFDFFQSMFDCSENEALNFRKRCKVISDISIVRLPNNILVHIVTFNSVHCTEVCLRDFVSTAYAGRPLVNGSHKRLDQLMQFVLNFGTDISNQNVFLHQRNKNLMTLGFNNETYTNVKVIVDGGQTVRVFNPILMARCEAIKAMMNGDFVEKQKNQINFPGISLEALKLFVSFCYTSHLDVLKSKMSVDVDVCLEALDIANRFCLTNFAHQLEVKLIEKLASLNEQDTCLTISGQILDTAKLYNCDRLAKWCLANLCCNFTNTDRNTWFEPLNEDTKKFVEHYSWPPTWYFDELRHYEIEMSKWEKQMEKRVSELAVKNKRCCNGIGSFLTTFVQHGSKLRR